MLKFCSIFYWSEGIGNAGTVYRDLTEAVFLERPLTFVRPILIFYMNYAIIFRSELPVPKICE